MPPRYLSLAIVAFWLATMGWLVYRDLWPRLRSGAPPAFAIDLVDEAQQFAQPTRWSVHRKDSLTGREQRLGRLRTWVEYRAADDTFALQSEMTNVRLALGFEVARLASTYRVDRDGRLRALEAVLIGDLGGTKLLEARLEGQVRDQQFHATFRSDPGVLDQVLGKSELVLRPVPVSASGSVLNPLHPVNRVAGLRPGMAWRLPLVDPLSDALAATFPGAAPGPRFLDAQVRAEPRPLTWNNQEVACLVIDYHQGGDTSARTWVRQRDGLVLRQEAHVKGEMLILQRE